jgi:hypothetical protein
MASTVDPAVISMLKEIEFLDETIEKAKAQNMIVLAGMLQHICDAIKKEYTTWTGLAYIEATPA